MTEFTALAYTITEACKVSGLGRTTIYTLISEHKLDARKASGRTLIMAQSLRDYLIGLPIADIRIGQSKAAA